MYIMTPLLWAVMQCGIVIVYRRCRATANSIFEDASFETKCLCIFIFIFCIPPHLANNPNQQELKDTNYLIIRRIKPSIFTVGNNSSL